MTTRPPTPRRDHGSVLPLVLIFVVVLGVIVAAISAYTATALRTTEIADRSISRLSAAESAMQLALQDAAANPSTCTGVTLVRAPINDAAVSTTCWRVAELSDLDTLFAIVLTGEGPDSGSGPEPVTQTALKISGANSDNGIKDISGPIFLAAPGEPTGTYVTIAPTNGRAVIPDPSNPSNSLGGVVRYEPASNVCPDPSPFTPAQWDGTPLRPPQVSCDERDWDEVAPPPDFSLDPTFLTLATDPAGLSATAAGPDTTTLPGCDIYEPGRYPTAPVTANPSYFRSGLYYFPTGKIDVGDATVIGKRTGSFFPDAATAGLDPACSPIWDDPGEDDSGAVFIMGTDARIWVKGNDARLHMYARELIDTGTPALAIDQAIVALTEEQAADVGVAGDNTFPGVVGVTLPNNGGVSPAPDKLVDRQNGSTSSISFYGQIYAPHSWVDTGNAAGSVFVEFLGGIVAGRITIKTAANVDGFVISVPTDIINAFYIESVAVTSGTLSNGTSTVRTRSTQVVGVPPAPDRLSVDSWRVCPRGNC